MACLGLLRVAVSLLLSLVLRLGACEAASRDSRPLPLKLAVSHVLHGPGRVESHDYRKIVKWLVTQARRRSAVLQWRLQQVGVRPSCRTWRP